MTIFTRIQNSMARAARFVRGNAASMLGFLRQARSPLAERLLADALRMAGIPSPTHNEERRAAFVVERLASLGISAVVDEDGNVLARIQCAEPLDGAPLLLFADLGSSRYHPLESLSRLDVDMAYGAGLADALGAAALLSLAESLLSGDALSRRELLLLFAAHALDNPAGGVFSRLAESAADRPVAALGLRGFALGSLVTRPQGTYRIEVKLRTDEDARDETDEGQPARPGAPEPASAVDAAVLVARKLSGVVWDADKQTACRIRRVEAGTGFGRHPTEGIVDIELESSNAAVLELAMKAAVATAESTGREAKARTEVSVVGYVPVGDAAVNKDLIQLALRGMKELRVKVRESAGPDPAAFLTGLGIPALAIGVALGREGLKTDQVVLDSLERGRKLVSLLTQRSSEEMPS